MRKRKIIKLYKKYSSYLNKDINDLNKIDHLAIDTFIYSSTNEFLIKNKASHLDTVLLTYYYCTIMLSYHLVNDDRLDYIQHNYRDKLLDIIYKELNYDKGIVSRLMINRLKLYNYAVSNSNYNSIELITHEAKNVFLYDLVYDENRILNNHEPMIAIGLNNELEIEKEILSFFISLKDVFDKSIKQMLIQ